LTYENDLQSGNFIGNFITGAVGGNCSYNIFISNSMASSFDGSDERNKGLVSTFLIYLTPVVIYRET
jgi:hypothetical protein